MFMSFLRLSFTLSSLSGNALKREAVHKFRTHIVFPFYINCHNKFAYFFRTSVRREFSEHNVNWL